MGHGRLEKFASQDFYITSSITSDISSHRIPREKEARDLIMPTALQALPELFSASVEAKVYSVAARDYTDVRTPPPGNPNDRLS